MPVMYPGELATASKSFGSIDEMWLAFGGLSTNKTPAINGDQTLYSATPRGSLIALAFKRTHTRPTGRAAALERLIRILPKPYCYACRTISTFP